jgi:hypothetical protein
MRNREREIEKEDEKEKQLIRGRIGKRPWFQTLGYSLAYS